MPGSTQAAHTSAQPLLGLLAPQSVPGKPQPAHNESQKPSGWPQQKGSHEQIQSQQAGLLHPGVPSGDIVQQSLVDSLQAAIGDGQSPQAPSNPAKSIGFTTPSPLMSAGHAEQTVVAQSVPIPRNPPVNFRQLSPETSPHAPVEKQQA